MTSLKKQTINGAKWKLIENFSIYGLRFILNIILARLLLPTDYGITGLIAVFLSVAEIFINSGFGSALIQKKDRTNIDYSTVFYFNLCISIICWIILFLIRNLIAEFFNVPLLAKMTPILAFTLIINAFGSVQKIRLMINLNFKSQTFASVISIIISGGISIYLAYTGLGIWALVVYSLVGALINTLLIWYFEKWTPLLRFSIKSLKSLFAFGSKMLLSSLIGVIYNNIYTLMIGKFFSAEDLGYYSRAKQFERLTSQQVTSSIQVVSYPALSRLQDDNKKLIEAFLKLMRMVFFIVTPLMIMIIVLAEPFILTLLKDKWAPSIPLLQLLCVGGIIYPVLSLNLILLHVKGRSDLFLRVTILQKVFITLTILITFRISIKAMIVGSIIASLIGLIINSHYTKKIINFGLWRQFKSFIPTIILSISMGVIIYYSTILIDANSIKLFVGSILGIIFYLTIAMIFKFSEVKEVKEIIGGILKKGK